MHATFPRAAVGQGGPARLPPRCPAASGPGDVLLQADKLWQQGAMLYQVQAAAALEA